MELKSLLENKTELKDPHPLGHCSAFIKPLPANQDLVFAHDSWYSYAAMLRILKLYKFNYRLTPGLYNPLRI